MFLIILFALIYAKCNDLIAGIDHNLTLISGTMKSINVTQSSYYYICDLMSRNYNAIIYRYTDSCVCDDSKFNYNMYANMFMITYNYRIVNETYCHCTSFRECINMGCKMPDDEYKFTAYVLSGKC
jgi:hypothetical protein